MTRRKNSVSKNDCCLASFEKLGLFCYVALMVGLFAMQAIASVQSYLAKEIVENVDVTPMEHVVLPSFTICPSPSYKTGNILTPIVDYCLANGTGIAECVDKARFKIDELFSPITVAYPARTMRNITDQLAYASANLRLGSCVTMDYGTELNKKPLGHAEIILLSKNNIMANYYIFIHESGVFVSIGEIGEEFTGQTWHSLKNKPLTFYRFDVTMTEMHHLDREANPCEKDDNYKVVKCMEDYVTSSIGCKSPWDMPEHRTEAKFCKSPEELRALQDIHIKLFAKGGYEFRQMTGCKRPCKINKVDAVMREIEDEVLNKAYGNASGIAIVSRHTNRKVVRETYLYSVSNLVGEVGGSMGLFLGASLISIYEYTT